MMFEKDYYEVLGVLRDATQRQIKERFRFLSHAYHPDKFPSHAQKYIAEAEFKRINEAYAVLSDETVRNTYDRDCAKRKKAEQKEVAVPVLERITYFAGPPFPRRDSPHDGEAYDFRRIQEKTLPPSKVDTLICDLWALATNVPQAVATSPAQLTKDDIRCAIRLYETQPWSRLRGYRPWTHWNFVNRLTPEERNTLAKEAHAYMIKVGIRNGET
jgi:hypothetical protein